MRASGERGARRRCQGSGKQIQGSRVFDAARTGDTLRGPAAPAGGELTVCLSNAVAPKPRAGSRRPQKRAAGAVSCRSATRASTARAAAAEHNAAAPLLRLHDGALAQVLALLQARAPRAGSGACFFRRGATRPAQHLLYGLSAPSQAPDLARLECVCRFFGAAGAGGLSLVGAARARRARHSRAQVDPFRPPRRAALTPPRARRPPAATALARMPALRREMPPWYATLGPLARLFHDELRAKPLSPADVAPGLWLRVRPDARAVQALCEPRDDAQVGPPAAGGAAAAGDDDDALLGTARGAARARAYVGWNDKMVDTLGRCFPVLGEVDERSWDVPVVGLRVPRGWACVAPPFGRRHECRAPCTGGWFYPLQALERV